MNELREMMRVEDDLLEPSSFATRSINGTFKTLYNQKEKYPAII
ncbi:unnamed protein product [Tenebrio molitor]|nr:unnamed protein product [Tenebrio molitor]